MFAKRTEWEHRVSLLGAAVERLGREGRAVLDLTETNPTRCGFHYSANRLESALADEAVQTYAPLPFGLPDARQAVAAYYAPQGITVAPGRVLITAGTSEAYSHLFRLLLNPGETVLVPSPSYPLLDMLARLNDVRLVPYPLHYDGRWWLDVDGLRDALDASCRAIVVISPNNPTGSCLKRAERNELEALAAERGLALIVDEVFGDYRLEVDPEDAGSMAGASRALTFTLNGISKMLGLPQMKLAWTVISGPEELAAQATLRLEIMADAYLSVGTAPQVALAAWLQRRSAIQAEIRERLRANLAQVRCLKSVECLHLEGGWCAVLRVPRLGPDEDFAADLLARDGVLVDPGSLFGFPTEGYVVVSLLPPLAIFAEGIRRLDRRVGL